jgi:hypothetical protein
MPLAGIFLFTATEVSENLRSPPRLPISTKARYLNASIFLVLQTERFSLLSQMGPIEQWAQAALDVEIKVNAFASSIESFVRGIPIRNIAIQAHRIVRYGSSLMAVRRLQEFWSSTAKGWIELLGLLLWPVALGLPAYGVRVFIRNWSESSRGFLSGFSIAGLIGAAVVYGICNPPRTIEQHRIRRMAGWVAIICLLAMLGSTHLPAGDDYSEPQI